MNSPDGPIYAFNALWFKPDGGAERYDEYLRAAEPNVHKHGTLFTPRYVPIEPVIGDFTPDLMFVAQWPNREALREARTSDEYKAIEHLREEALSDSALTVCTSPGPIPVPRSDWA